MSKCKQCGAEIIWEQNDNDRWIPMDLDSHCHFETCPDRKEAKVKALRLKAETAKKKDTYRFQARLSEYGLTDPLH